MHKFYWEFSNPELKPQKTQKAGFQEPFAQKFLPKIFPRLMLTYVNY
jgi:hypothetical protein